MKYAFVNGIILDGKKDMKPVTGRAVLTDGNRIVDIVSDLAALRGYEIIDLKGAYLLPGLIDLHVHLALSGKPPKPKKDNKATDYEKLYKILTGNALIRAAARQLVASYAKTEVMSGVTTIRTVGGVLDFDAQVRDLIREGKLIGPRIIASNTGISVPGGHFAGSIATAVETPDEAKAIARGMLASGWKQWDTAEQWEALEWLWEHESGWRWDADNPTSDAYGIPQALPGRKMASAGEDWKHNAATQIRWGLGYIQSRYGSPTAAKAFWLSHHWY